MSSWSKRRDSQAMRDYNARPPVDPGKLRKGCVLWIRDKSSVDRHIPSLTNGLKVDDWVYDHPCVVLAQFQHTPKGQIVKVAPLTSRRPDPPSEYIPISPLNAANRPQLSLRNNRQLDKQSYVKKICFEIDIRVLALYNGVPADTFRLTKGSMKMLLGQLPSVIEWAPQPVSSSSNGILAVPDGGSVYRPNYAAERLDRDVEGQPLIRPPDSLVSEYGSGGFSGKSPYVTRTQQTRYIAESTLKLVLCVPVLLALIACIAARFICEFILTGPVTTYDAVTNLLLVLWKKGLADVVGNCQVR